DVRDLAEVTTTAATVTAVTAVAGDGLLGLPGHPLDHPATDGLGEPGRAVPAGDLLADLADRRGGLLHHRPADLLTQRTHLGGHRPQDPLAGDLQQFLQLLLERVGGQSGSRTPGAGSWLFWHGCHLR